MPRFYFDLGQARKSLANGETPWTPAVGVLFGLDAALEMLEQEGYPHIFARHAACAAAARAGLSALGFRLFADPAHASQTVTAAWMPDGVEWSALNKANAAARPRRGRRPGSSWPARSCASATSAMSGARTSWRPSR